MKMTGLFLGVACVVIAGSGIWSPAAHGQEKQPCPPGFGGTPVGSCRGPSWFQAMPDKTWVAVAAGSGYGAAYQNGARIIDQIVPDGVGNSPSGITQGFVGGVVDQARGEMLLAANGGHASHKGNEVYAVQFRSEVPAVVRLTDQSPASVVSETSFIGNVRIDNGDGLPRASHTYNSLVYDQSRSLIIFPMSSGYHANGVSSSIFTFNRQAVDDYVEQGGTLPVPYQEVAANAGNGSGYWQYRGLSHASGWGGGITYSEKTVGFWDPVDNKAGFVWDWIGDPDLNSNQWVWQLDPAVSGTWTTGNGGVTYTGAGISENVRSKAAPGFVADNVDPPIYVQLMDTVNSSVWVLDLSNKAAGFQQRSLSGASPPNWERKGAVYHPASNAGLVGEISSTGANFYKIKLDDPSDPTNTTFTLSLITPSASNTTTPVADNAEAGGYSKWNIIQNMGNGQGAIIATDWFEGPSYVFKLPAGEVN